MSEGISILIVATVTTLETWTCKAFLNLVLSLEMY